MTADKTTAFDYDTAHQSIVALRNYIASQVPNGVGHDQRGWHMMISFTEGGEIRYTIRRGYDRAGQIEDACHPGELIAELRRRLEWADTQRVKGLPQIGNASVAGRAA